ncbi:MAG: DegT/DnrJ/EryC1/StrS family aminotransferase [Pseudonocardia sp.]|nr:DegT/DnrJ/EryC1/StrS family aminotransferase [Pseudonocardia sp.]
MSFQQTGHRLLHGSAQTAGQDPDPATTASNQRRIPLAEIDIGPIESGYVNTAMTTGWISGTGPFVRSFERRIAERIDRRHVVATANGTLAIELALRALGIGPGDEVIVPVLTFAAPASSVLAVGATPVLVDIDPVTWTIAPAEAARHRTDRTRAVIAVDVLGHPADYDALTDLGLPVIEDAAEAHGAKYKGRPVGSLGDIATFSFHANKSIATGEGGCAATDSAELADQMRVIANHGMRPERPYLHETVGRNFRMTNLTAAVGLGQLDRWDELLGARALVVKRYSELLADVECQPRPVAHWADYSCWLHTLRVANRDAVVAGLQNLGIDARAIWPLLSTQSVFGHAAGPFPVATEVADTAFWLPTFARMTAEDIRFVADSLKAAISRKPGR